jgi:acetyl esterase/lipase
LRRGEPTGLGGRAMIRRNIAYAPEHGTRGQLDLYLPEGAESRSTVVVVHGGGLQALNKERMDGVSAYLAEQGWAVANVNYRLLPDHPFPAPLLDVLSAIQWVRETDRPDLGGLDRTRVALLGASAGGYLAMMAGLLLGPAQVRSIVSISGSSLRSYAAEEQCAQRVQAEGLDPRLFYAPVELVRPGAPPLLCTHSRIDTVVGVEHSQAIVQRMNEAGCRAELYLYEGHNDLHGIWRDDGPHLRLVEHIEAKIAAFLRQTVNGAPFQLLGSVAENRGPKLLSGLVVEDRE